MMPKSQDKRVGWDQKNDKVERAATREGVKSAVIATACVLIIGATRYFLTGDIQEISIATYYLPVTIYTAVAVRVAFLRALDRA